MAVDWSSFHVLANTSELVQEGVLSLPPAARTRPDRLPESYWNKILMMHGQDARLVLEKRLRPTDMDSGQGRLSIPRLQIRANFLSSEEIRTLNNRESITIPLIEPCLEVRRGLQLKKWNYNNRNFSYVLTKQWNLVAHPFEWNQLREHGLIQLWSFRENGHLCFCLVNCEAPPAAE
ncbi:hypothetical protein BT93_L1481 [Corymbia citriodora subsp. variegata]|uniref:Uncharacterized protein n=1 Tax=Corymbia citriodora subsp. variegata TaxID=360336 RepID=A0A8T0CS14_CORYI|nr:hypothetical protein BT93_L1481 [Corymbia citriodora subsp. variegata]